MRYVLYWDIKQQSGKFLPIFQDKLLAPSLEVKKTVTTAVDRHRLFWGLCPISDYLQNSNISETDSVTVLRQRSTRCNP
jgi:hypothetical protein